MSGSVDNELSSVSWTSYGCWLEAQPLRTHMTKEYRIRSESYSEDTTDDCYLDPADPIHEIKKQAGLKDRVVNKFTPQEISDQGLEPGTVKWFQMMFGR